MSPDELASAFEQHRPRLRAVAYRMLGNPDDADDALQEAWLRLNRTGDAGIDNLAAWLTTVTGRICLDMLRSRSTRREDPLPTGLPDDTAPEILDEDSPDPARQAELADMVGLAMQVVLESLDPAERLAFVLHDLFGLAFAEIAPIVERSPDATKMLASRARRRVRDARAAPDPDIARQRAAVDAFQAAARDGDFEALLRVLDPEVVLRSASVDALSIVRGADAVASGAVTFKRLAVESRPVLVNGAAGVAAVVDGAVFSLAAFTVVDGRIVEIDIIADPERLRTLGVAAGD